MAIRFPDPRLAGPDGLVALGGALSEANLIQAYRMGIFPWPVQGLPLTWFCPEERGVLFVRDYRIPRSFQRFLKKHTYQITQNQDFSGVIGACAQVPRKDEGTWITPEIEKAYIQLHRKGYAHSIEIWNQNELVGGLYGVDVDGVFSAESMFRTASNTSKLALHFLIEKLKATGRQWIDIQVITPHTQFIGARSLQRDRYLDLLDQTKSSNAKPLF